MMRRELLNALARRLYQAQGYEVAEGYDFTQARHPSERLCYVLASVAAEFFCERGLFDEGRAAAKKRMVLL